jgi:suppressor for copper-sensitivity B
MGETLEEWIDMFDAVAPIWYRTGATPGDDASRQILALDPRGKIEALCCDENTCIPVRKEFSVSLGTDPTQLAILFEAVEKHGKPGSVNDTPNETLNKNEKPTTVADFSLLRNLLYAFFGGMILNIMPCVLPIIGLKIVGFFEQAGRNRSRAFFLNLCYTSGVLSVFTVLALMSVGLSYLFTYGVFQIVMGCVVFAMALNLMGVWEITLPEILGGPKSNDLMRKEGGFGGWIKGVITTLLAIPCGAPMLSPALVWTDALMKNGSVFSVLLVYWVIGLGMAAPFLVIGAFPELLKFLPKPGAWMETFRKIMGFILLPAVIWILYSMPLELILPMTVLLAAIWFSCWYLGHNQYDPDRKRWRIRLTALAVAVAALLFSFEMPALQSDVGYPFPTMQGMFREKLTRWGIRAARDGELAQTEWKLFDRAEFDRELASGKRVAIDFTADWCVNCKVLEAAVLRAPEIETLFREKEILTMTGDWTNRDDSAESRAVGDLLRRYGGEQVPVLMIFTPETPEEPIILRGLFTKETLTKTLETF